MISQLRVLAAAWQQPCSRSSAQMSENGLLDLGVGGGGDRGMA